MSGIAGIYNIDGRPVNKQEITGMVESMSHRGPDGRDIWNKGSVGFGHCMLQTTPESLNEKLPLVSKRGELVITSDARIDNRNELFSQLLIKKPAPEVPDSELILEAYQKWGERCVEHLLGDFAFSIWDNKKKQLFLARDHFGIKQLYYTLKKNNLFVFGTEIKSILTLERITEQLNDNVIGIYLAGGVEPEETIFRAVVRLLPGHAMVVSPSGTKVWKYWELKPAETAQDLSDEEYTEQFLDLFTEAVRVRLRSAFPVSAELSGGLDSSFVTAVAHNLLREQGHLPLQTISTIYNSFTECDERLYIKEVVKDKDIVPHFCAVDSENITELLDEIYNYLDDARVAGNHHLNWLTARESGKIGARILLTGQDGDTTVWHGWQYFYELAQQGNWNRFAHEAKKTIENSKKADHKIAKQVDWNSPEEILGAYASPFLAKWAENKQYYKVIKSLHFINKYFSVHPLKILYKLRLKLIKPYIGRNGSTQSHISTGDFNFLNTEFVNRINLETLLGKLCGVEKEPLSTRKAQQKTLESPYLSLSFETIDHYGAAAGVEPRHPFMDLRLVRYCLSLPAEQSFANGWSRAIMRRAMKGIVPDKIRWRVEKANLSPAFKYLYSRADYSDLFSWIRRSDKAQDFIDVNQIQSTVNIIPELKSTDWRNLSRSYSFLLWLSRKEKRQNYAS